MPAKRGSSAPEEISSLGRGDETHATNTSRAEVRKPRRRESGRKHSSNRAALAEDVFLRDFVKSREKAPTGRDPLPPRRRTGGLSLIAVNSGKSEVSRPGWASQVVGATRGLPREQPLRRHGKRSDRSRKIATSGRPGNPCRSSRPPEPTFPRLPSAPRPPRAGRSHAAAKAECRSQGRRFGPAR